MFLNGAHTTLFPNPLMFQLVCSLAARIGHRSEYLCIIAQSRLPNVIHDIDTGSVSQDSDEEQLDVVLDEEHSKIL
jgi:hypothetical protein